MLRESNNDIFIVFIFTNKFYNLFLLHRIQRKNLAKTHDIESITFNDKGLKIITNGKDPFIIIDNNELNDIETMTFDDKGLKIITNEKDPHIIIDNNDLKKENI